MTKSADPSNSNLVAFAHELADAAGAAILPHFRRRLAVASKAGTNKADANKPGDSGYDPVTAADKAAERAIRKLVRARYPDHGFEGEEYGNEGLDARWRWVVDPIDGTRSFVLGLPVWGTLIGLTKDGAPQVGVMDQPYTRERFWAGAKGAFLRDADGRQRRLKARQGIAMSDAMLMTTHPELFAAGAEMQSFARVKEKARACRYGGDCYAYCMLAAGHVDLIVEAGLKPYDITALIPIIERAGGVITTWTGEPAARGGRIVAAGDARLHAAAVRLLS